MKTALELEQLVALCEEIKALTAAGIPLDRGLSMLSRDLPPRLRRESERISQRLANGESLADIVAQSSGNSPGLPTVLQAVIEAGQAVGNLTAPLAGFTRVAKQMLEVRQIVQSALLYPAIVLIVLCVLSAMLLGQYQTLMETWKTDVTLSHGPSVSHGAMIEISEWLLKASAWFWILPAALAGLILFWMLALQTVSEPQKFARQTQWIPGASSLLKSGRRAGFSNALELLIEHRCPLPQGLRLAAAATGDPALINDCQQFAAAIEAGDDPRTAVPLSGRGLPPLLGWTICHQSDSERLQSALRYAGESYRRQLELSATWMKQLLPAIMIITIGGTATLLYALAVIGNLYGTLRDLV